MRDNADLEQATLGGGCFWCLEPVYEGLRGVERVEPGYAGGHVPNPTYRQVSTGTTGHAEVVRITFDPDQISYRDLLDVFFTIHDPTTPNRQGADVGPQYRSLILYHSDAQRETAERTIDELQESGTWDAPIVTELAPAGPFYPAEAHHRHYYERNPDQPYCRIVIAPKVAKARQKFADLLKR